MSRLSYGLGVLVLGLSVWSVDAQQAPTIPLPSPERLRIELAYTKRLHEQCVSSLSDIWAQGEALEQKVRRLEEENQKLREALDAAKTQHSGG